MSRQAEPFIATKWFHLSELRSASEGGSPMNSSWSKRFSGEWNKSPRGCAEGKPCGYRFETHIVSAGDSNRHRMGSRKKMLEWWGKKSINTNSKDYQELRERRAHCKDHLVVLIERDCWFREVLLISWCCAHRALIGSNQIYILLEQLPRRWVYTVKGVHTWFGWFCSDFTPSWPRKIIFCLIRLSYMIILWSVVC